jgi:hypothetical protein
MTEIIPAYGAARGPLILPEAEHGGLARTGAETLYGTEETRAGAAHWARGRGLHRSTGYWQCAHGLLRRGRRWPCGCEHASIVDHRSLWVSDGRPVVLITHPYPYPTLAADARLYAEMHGLAVVIGDDGDAWYGAGAVPVRFELRDATSG